MQWISLLQFGTCKAKYDDYMAHRVRNKPLKSYLFSVFFRVTGFCPEFGHILNGQVVHVTPKVGQATVRFHCNKTHRLIGKPRLECINGRWNGALPFCESALEIGARKVYY